MSALSSRCCGGHTDYNNDTVQEVRIIEMCSKYSENTEECDCVTGIGGAREMDVNFKTKPTKL